MSERECDAVPRCVGTCRCVRVRPDELGVWVDLDVDYGASDNRGEILIPLAHIAAVLRDEATVEAVMRAIWPDSTLAPCAVTEMRLTAATRAAAVIADRLGASQPREGEA